MSDSLNHPDVRRALELAAKGTAEDDVPRELANAVHWCIASKLIKIIRAYAVIPDKWQHEESLLDRLIVLPEDPNKQGRKFLLLQEQGEVELAKLRLGDKRPPTEEWSEAKSPAEWQQELNFSDSTWRRHINNGKLIVKRITTKSVCIRKDTLRQFQGTK